MNELDFKMKTYTVTGPQIGTAIRCQDDEEEKRRKRVVVRKSQQINHGRMNEMKRGIGQRLSIPGTV